MKLLGDVCVSLGKGLAEVLAMSATELGFWDWYRGEFGLPADRIETTTALSGAAVCASRGMKVKPLDLLPYRDKPTESTTASGQRLIQFLAGYKSVRIYRRDKSGNVTEMKRPGRGKPAATTRKTGTRLKR